MVATSPPDQGQGISAVSFSRQDQHISASVEFKGMQVTLTGDLDAQGMVSLRGENSPVLAEAICTDIPQCESVIVDVFAATDKGIVSRQFASSTMVKPVNKAYFTGEFTGSPRREAALASLAHPTLMAVAPPGDHDAAIGPWLDLKGGGIADGPSQGKKDSGVYGALENGQELPVEGDGIKRLDGNARHNSFGTGFMISLLQDSAAAYHAKHADQTVYVGAIAQERGGYFPPHSSHQNGLDADILFIGTKTYASVLDKGVVSDRFKTELNWEYWRSLTAQKIVQNGREIPVVSMILVAPELKKFLCEWAKNTGHMSDPADIDLLKRLRPTEGHDTHFHTRLQCSPYHPKCLKQYDPGLSKDTGC
jgi:penicillin-insensitive murein endopeptidase